MGDEKQIIGTDVFWAASKNKSYRALIQSVFRTLIEFLQRNGLVTKELLPEGAEVDGTFVMRRSDLTDEGYEFYRAVEQGWFNAIDRGAAPTNKALLERTLRKLRSKP